MNQSPKTLASALAELSVHLGISEADIGGKLTITGKDPFVASPHHIGESTAVLLGLFGMELAAIWKERTGRGQDVNNTSNSGGLQKKGLCALEFCDCQTRHHLRRDPLLRFHRTLGSAWRVRAAWAMRHRFRHQRRFCRPTQEPADVSAQRRDDWINALTGMLEALRRRAREGGSYLVRASLAKNCDWLQGFGLIRDSALTGLPNSKMSAPGLQASLRPEFELPLVTSTGPMGEMSVLPCSSRRCPKSNGRNSKRKGMKND
jgi:hypothetical protein